MPHTNATAPRSARKAALRRFDNVTSRNETSATRLIALAVSLIADPEALPRKIGCSAEEFLAYCRGTKDLEWHHFDALISLITYEQALLIAKHRQLVHKLQRIAPADPLIPRE
jgi:hypothetical protein